LENSWQNPLWSRLSREIEPFGLTIFDLEIPKNTRGALRLFIARLEMIDGKRKILCDGVTHLHCSTAARHILDLPDVEELLPGDVTLEVSSPGVNRKLTRPEHFEGALGERIAVSYKESEAGEVKSLKGVLKSVNLFTVVLPPDTNQGGCEGLIPFIEVDCGEIVEKIPFLAISKAKVDFDFK
jgi:ribosome maturation factor RimP